MPIKTRPTSEEQDIVIADVIAKDRKLVNQERYSVRFLIHRKRSGAKMRKLISLLCKEADFLENPREKEIARRASFIIKYMQKNRQIRQSALAKSAGTGLSARKRTQNHRFAEKQRVISSPVNRSNQEFKRLTPDEVTKAFNNAIKQDIARKQERGLPIARYDKKSKRAYLESADGTREYV